jgi:PAS domain S-box-containing protein
MTQTATLAPPPLGGQIQQLIELNETIRLSLQKIAIAPETMGKLTLLTQMLSHLKDQAVRQEAERNNLRALAGIGQVVNSSLQLDEVLRIVMDTIVRLTGAERGFLMLRDGRGELVTHIARNWEQETVEANEFAISRSVIGRVVAEGQPMLTTNAQEDPRFGDKASIIAYNLRSILCVPLKVKGELIGVIYADNRIRAGLFSSAERNLLAAFADQAAVAIENARLFESVRRTLAEVTELKNLMDDVFASIASGVITSDLQDRITLANHAAENILGCSQAELVGQRVDGVLPPLGFDSADYLATVRLANRQVLGLEIHPTVPPRGILTLNLNLSPLKDAEQTTRGVAMVLEDLTEQRRLEAQRRLFERMVSPAVIEQLDPDELQLGGKRLEITALFADIRGFTSFSEKIDPETLVTVLNRYLAAAAEAILAEQGTIDKFLGDAVMAWFNAPIPQPDHTLRAVRAALGLRAAIQRLQSQMLPEFRLSFGVGIHFGEAVLGLVGTEKRLEYTAIGDSVNTAKRIQENSAGGQILLSAAAYTLIHDQIEVRPVAPVHAKGKSQPLEVYEVIGMK